MCEMRTCKTCGETKPLETGFPKCYGKPNRNLERKIYYENYCLECKVKRRREWHAANYARQREDAKSDEEVARHALAAAIKAQEEARAVINLFESIKAAREACPILSFSLWTGDTPQRLGAW